MKLDLHLLATRVALAAGLILSGAAPVMAQDAQTVSSLDPRDEGERDRAELRVDSRASEEEVQRDRRDHARDLDRIYGLAPPAQPPTEPPPVLPPSAQPL